MLIHSEIWRFFLDIFFLNREIFMVYILVLVSDQASRVSGSKISKIRKHFYPIILTIRSVWGIEGPQIMLCICIHQLYYPQDHHLGYEALLGNDYLCAWVFFLYFLSWFGVVPHTWYLVFPPKFFTVWVNYSLING